MTSVDADVIVAGGGPAGAATATRLARLGWEVLLFDKARFPREKPCAEFLSPGAVAQLHEVDILDAVQATSPARLEGMRIEADQATCDIRYTQPDGTHGAMGIQRPVLDSILLEQARSQGVRVCEGTVVLGSLGEQGRVHGVIVRQGTSGCREVQARFVVGADGPHSRIAGSLGLNRSARWPRRLGLTARYAGDFPATGFGTMVVGSDSYCGLAPLGHGLLNVGLVIPLGAHNSSEPVATLFERQIRGLPGVRSRLGTAERVTDIRGSGPLAHSVRRVAGPGYVLVGDAAGFLDPFTGEGIFRALRGAELAAHVIDAALREGQEATATVARAYRHARTRAFQDKERLCWLVQLFLTQRPLFSYILRRLHSRPNLRAVLAGALGDFGPAASALSPAFLSSLLRP